MGNYSIKNYKNIGAAIVVLCFAVALFIASFYVESSTVTTLGPEFMPRVVAITIFLLGLLNLRTAINDYRFLKKNGKLEPKGPKKSFREIFLDNLDWASGILMMVYVIAIYHFGFLLPSIIYMFLQILLYTTNTKRNFVLYIIVSIVIPCAVYFLFRNYFHLLLPKGILG